LVYVLLFGTFQMTPGVAVWRLLYHYDILYVHGYAAYSKAVRLTPCLVYCLGRVLSTASHSAASISYDHAIYTHNLQQKKSYRIHSPQYHYPPIFSPPSPPMSSFYIGPD